MNDLGRYERMAQRARERKAKAEAEQERAEIEVMEARRAEFPAAFGPPLEGEHGPIDYGMHRGHYVHNWGAHGNSTWCSCGAFMGIFSFALTGDEPPPPDHCHICRARGIEGKLWSEHSDGIWHDVEMLRRGGGPEGRT